MSKELKDFMEEFAKDEAALKERPVKAFFVHTYDFFRYRIPVKFSETTLKVKWAFQRMFRGYDDGWRWCYYSSNTDVTIEVLKWMQTHKHGSPYTRDSKKSLKTQFPIGDATIAGEAFHKRWDEALNLMIEGFEALRELDDLCITDKNGKYDKKANDKARKVLEKKWKIGSTLFIENYRGLWD